MIGHKIIDSTFRNNVQVRVGTLALGAQTKRFAVDCQPSGKWRVGDTIGFVPKGHDCIIEGFVVRKGKTVRKGKVTLVPNGGKDIHYIMRGNDIG